MYVSDIERPFCYDSRQGGGDERAIPQPETFKKNELIKKLLENK